MLEVAALLDPSINLQDSEPQPVPRPGNSNIAESDFKKAKDPEIGEMHSQDYYWFGCQENARASFHIVICI
jgi:hypothetical protein